MSSLDRHPATCTQTQLAELAGVSQNTVNRALRGLPGVGESTRERIESLARRYGYRFNTASQAMVSGRFNAVAMVTRHDIGPLQTFVGKGVHRGLDQLGLRMVFTSVDETEFRESADAPQFLRELSVDGAVVHFSHSLQGRLEALLRQHRVPVAWVNDKRVYDCIYPDDLGAARLAVEQLLAAGHRRIGYSGVSRGDAPPAEFRPHYSVAERETGYRTTMEAAGLRPHVVDPPSKWRSLADRVRAWREHLRAEPRATAWITYQESDASALVAAAASLGLDVPRDLSLIAFGWDEWMGPGRLSMMQIPLHEVGEAAVAMLHDKIAGGDPQQPSVRIPYTPPGSHTLARPNE